MTAIDKDLNQQVLARAELAVSAFNSGDVATLDRLFAVDAISVQEDGSVLSGPARTEGRAEVLALRPVMTARVLESYVTSDTALLVVDWSIEVDTAEGGPERHSGTALDVLRRRGDDWLYVIDNPYGTQI
ncbi:YybH family protein [Streptomyces sp. NPDC013187]|uniref:YybH family protein n=1 Tax=Streptomyces sp. NPDC013187 TaxID=3364865 RepID=UPI0036AF5803